MRAVWSLAAAGCMLARAAGAVEPVTPPAMYPPDTWQGRADAVVRVQDRLDAHIEILTIAAGQSARFKSLTIAVQGCLQHPPSLPPDNAARLTITDQHAAASDFAGWMFTAEPFVGVFQSPVYGVHLVSCAGAEVAPAAPPMPPPVMPPPVIPPAIPPATPASPPPTTD